MATIIGRYEKQTAEVLDYYVLFDEWFDNRADLPQSFTVIADAGITVAASSLTGTTVKIVLGGGVSGTKYKITVRLTTNATPAIVKEADFTVRIKDI
jgi:hypothetical protein